MADTYSAAQRALLAHVVSPDTTIVAVGAVRSGKSYAIQQAFAAFLCLQQEPWDHALVAISVEVAMRNLGFGLLDSVRVLGGSAEIDKRYGTRIQVQGAHGALQSVWVIGAADERARRRIQGSTMKSLVIEEATLLPRDFFHFAWTRLSVAGAKMWASLNPEGPSHWFKLEVVDKLFAYDGRLVKFLMRDNPSLLPETIQRYEASLEGFRYARLIEGEWAAAAGAIWPHVKITDEVPDDHKQVTLVLDWATSGTMAVIAVRHNWPVDRAVVAHELYHVGRDEGLLTADEAAAKVAAWCVGEVGFAVDGVRVLHDPSMPDVMEQRLRFHGFVVGHAVNDVLPGIALTNSLLREEHVVLHRRCGKLLTEIRGYSWDEQAAMYGEDKPLKSEDHGCDDLRYFCATLWAGHGLRSGATLVSGGLHSVRPVREPSGPLTGLPGPRAPTVRPRSRHVVRSRP